MCPSGSDYFACISSFNFHGNPMYSYLYNFHHPCWEIEPQAELYLLLMFAPRSGESET